MEYQVSSAVPSDSKFDWVVYFVDHTQVDSVSKSVPEDIANTIGRLTAAEDLPKKSGELKSILGWDSELAPRLLLVGLGAGDQKKMSEGDEFRRACTAARSMCDKADRKILWILPESELSADKTLELAVMACELGVQSQGVYQAESKRHPYQLVHFVAADSDKANAGLKRGEAFGHGVNLTRDLINRCSEEITPIAFAEKALEVANELGMACEVFDQARLEKERMTSLLSVARGSGLEPRVVKLEHAGGGKDAPWISLVGKGVTYDSGGLSIKPTDSMKTMKSDMSGAATVLGVMQIAAALNLPVNLRGYAGLVENMISGRAYRVGDVITARNGTTIEVLNTDAEGRLVLADVLCYAVDEGCDRMIDLATLTGSCVVALGEDFTGVFTNDQSWCDQLVSAAQTTGEKLWQLPMCDSFNDQLKSEVADCKNVGTRWGGSITAAKFLEKFVGSTPWIHCDIAGPAFRSDSAAYREGGASGVMVRTLVRLLESMS